eukprot:scaffold601369_cov45-Prasinocladus_malaysianus.AAC.1
MLAGHLTCQLCEDIFQQPVSVHGRCQHVFCYQCILQTVAHANLAGKPNFACPTCGNEAETPDSEET